MIVDQRIERPTERLTDLLTYQIILYIHVAVHGYR